MKNKKLNATQILNKAGQKYNLLKIEKFGFGAGDYNGIRSDQIKAVVEVLVEEINEILLDKTSHNV